MGEKEINAEALAAARGSQNERMGDVLIVQIEEVRRAVVGLKDSQVFRPEMRIQRLAPVMRKKKGQVRIVGVEQPQSPEIVGMIARQDREPGVEPVIGLFDKLRVVRRKDLVTFSDGATDA